MITVRLAITAKDLKLARALFKKGFGQWAYGPDFNYYFSVINKDRLKRGELLLAYVDGKPAGMLSFAYHTYVFSRSIWLENATTLREFRGKGVATALMEKALQTG